MNNWTEVKDPGSIRIEPLLDELARHPNFDEIHVRETTVWTWTRRAPEPDEAGIRCGRSASLVVVDTSWRPGFETTVAQLLLDGDVVTHYELDDTQPYRVLMPVAKAVR